MNRIEQLANFLSPKLEVKACADKPGLGVFAVAALEPGELIAVWGGRIVSRAEAEAFPAEQRRYVLQVEEAHYLAPLIPIDTAEYVNHCCQPNAGMVGQITLAALRRIEPGEEVTFDYATTDSSDFLGFECSCARAPCRGRVAGDDWRRADVQAVNCGHFSPYLQRLIAKTKSA